MANTAIQVLSHLEVCGQVKRQGERGKVEIDWRASSCSSLNLLGQRQSPGAQQLSVIISLEGRRSRCRRGHLDPAIILLRAVRQVRPSSLVRS